MEILNNSQHPYPRLCAHRGAHKGVAPENSMISYQRALELGADEIEIDLWPSKEGEMFAFHDATVKKITGTPTYISDLTSKEIRALDMGVGFAPEFKGMQIPTFEEVLDLVARRVIINIHIKTPVKNRMITPTLRSRFDHWKVLYASPEALMPPFPDCEGEIDWEYENRPMARYDERDFRTILDLLDKYRPMYLLHGHVHLRYGVDRIRERMYGSTRVINTCERYVLDLPDVPIPDSKKNQLLWAKKIKEDTDYLSSLY